jgi:hypothetical protein
VHEAQRGAATVTERRAEPEADAPGFSECSPGHSTNWKRYAAAQEIFMPYSVSRPSLYTSTGNRLSQRPRVARSIRETAALSHICRMIALPG